MKKNFKLLLTVAVVALAITSCKKDVEQEDNQNELITTVQLNFTPVGGGNELKYKWEDLDGEGGATPVIEMVTLAANQTYTVEILLLDKTKNPVDTISHEVREEGTDHRFYYEPTSANITVSNLDNDANGAPVGLTSTWATSAAGTGSIKITLRHYENGGKALNDLMSDPKSSTDMEAQFNTTVQ